MSRSEALANTSNPDPKIAVLILGQLHEDPVPLQLVNRLADFFLARNVRVVIGLEFGEDFKETLHKENQFLIEYKKFREGDESQRRAALDKLRTLPPLREFINSVELMKRRGAYFPPNVEIDFLEKDKLVQKRLSTGLATQRMWALVEKCEKRESDMSCFSCEDAKSDESLSQVLDTDRRVEMLKKMENQRTDVMAQKVMQQIKQKSSGEDRRDCVIIVANLGLMHAHRLHAKVVRDANDPKICVRSAIVANPNNRGEVQKFLAENKSLMRKEQNEMGRFYEQTKCLEFCVSEAAYKKNPTDPILSEFYERVAGDIAQHFGIERGELKGADSRASSQAPQSAVAAASAANARSSTKPNLDLKSK